MKSRAISIAAVVLCTFTGGCSTTYRLSSVTPDQSDAWARLECAGRIRSSYVLAHQEWIRAERFAVRDSTLVAVRNGPRSTEIPLADVEQVVFRNAGNGAAHGALVGLGISFLAGISVAASFSGPGDGGTATSWGLAIGGLIGSVTVPAGALIGAIIGSPDRFRFESTNRDSRRSP